MSERRNRLIIALCAVLFILVAAQYVVMLAAFPIYYQRVSDGQVPTLVSGGDSDISPAILADKAAARGLSLSAYAIYSLAVNLVIAAVFCGAAALILWKHGRDWFRWLAALMLAFFPGGGLYVISRVAFPGADPFLSAGGLLWPGFLIFLYLFPDGRAVPRWSRWPMAVLLLAHLAFQFVGFLMSLPRLARPIPADWAGVASLVIAAEFVLLLICQVYRYIRVAGAVERRQIQWFVAGIAMVVIGSTVVEGLRDSAATASTRGYFDDLDSALSLAIPAAITISILRYRLWDIDVIIRRTLLYAVLTGLLAAVYFGSVVVVGGILRVVTGQGQSALVTVLSTLAIAALFVPLRRRVQSALDRRFYRRKYDAARTLAAFAAGARDETDLEQLTAHLEHVVEQTMQPEHLSLVLISNKAPRLPPMTGPS